MTSSNIDRRPLAGPSVWHGTEMAACEDWHYRIDDAGIAELEAATERALAKGIEWRDLSRRDFELPTLSLLLDQVADALERGPGLARLTGLEPSRYDEVERRTLYFGLALNLGTPVSMSQDGMMMSDVTDEGAAAAEKYGKVALADDEDFLSSRSRVQSTGPLRYHNDRCDVVSLLCVSAAKSGGVSRIASVPKIHNEMLARRPDLLELLYHDYYRSRLGEEFGDNAAWYALPVFATANDKFTCHYSRTFIEAAQLNDEVPKMAPEHWQAIELMAEIADEVALETTQQPGEIQLLNNHVTFHARTAYEDHPEPARRRLLHRLWLSMPNSRPLPDSYRVLFREIAPGAVRGGILPVSPP
jgi:hypothetical protein